MFSNSRERKLRERRKELSEKLGVMYNRARQGAITQELTEIVAGANAI